MKYVIGAMHFIAERWGLQQGWKREEFITVTQARTIASLATSTEIHVVDSKVSLQDSRNIEKVLRKFTHVQRHSA